MLVQQAAQLGALGPKPLDRFVTKWRTFSHKVSQVYGSYRVGCASPSRLPSLSKKNAPRSPVPLLG